MTSTLDAVEKSAIARALAQTSRQRQSRRAGAGCHARLPVSAQGEVWALAASAPESRCERRPAVPHDRGGRGNAGAYAMVCHHRAVRAVALVQVVLLIRFAAQSSREVARFLEAVSFDDTSQSFSGLTGRRCPSGARRRDGACSGSAAHRPCGARGARCVICRPSLPTCRWP